MHKRRNIIIGLLGLALTILVAAIIPVNRRIAVLVAIPVGLFFVGYSFGGFVLALFLFFLMAGVAGVAVAPGKMQIPVMVFFFGPIYLLPMLWVKYMNKRYPDSDEDDDLPSDEEIAQALSNNIYLIKPNLFKGDVLYKVVDRDGYLYFCRCGGQSYIPDMNIVYNHELTQTQLLAHKDSFRIMKKSIVAVDINTKLRAWTGPATNNGTVNIIAEEKYSFIIHGRSSLPQLQEFLHQALNHSASVKVDRP